MELTIIKIYFQKDKNTPLLNRDSTLLQPSSISSLLHMFVFLGVYAIILNVSKISDLNTHIIKKHGI